MNFDWDENKNKILKENRKISFEEIVLLISEGKIVDVLEHPNKTKYSNQRIYLVKYDNYIYAVPFIKDEDNEIIFLKTIIPSRKYTKLYCNGGGIYGKK